MALQVARPAASEAVQEVAAMATAAAATAEAVTVAVETDIVLRCRGQARMPSYTAPLERRGLLRP